MNKVKYQTMQEDGYSLGTLIGKGSVGTVYEGNDPKGRCVAIKFMDVTPFQDEKLLDSIVEGARATRKIERRANIVPLFDTGRKNDYYYIVMQLFRRGTLERMISDPHIPLKTKTQIGLSLANSLSAVHEAGIIHGDLKPSNVLMSDDNEPYIIDFYQASVNASANEFRPLPKGTPLYMSPEQALGKFINAHTDIYSFGVLLYELLTGRLPYPRHPETVSDMVEIIQEGKMEPPSKHLSAISSNMDAVVMKLLERKTENRYENMEQVVADIRACLEGSPLLVAKEKSLFQKVKGWFN